MASLQSYSRYNLFTEFANIQDMKAALKTKSVDGEHVSFWYCGLVSLQEETEGIIASV